MFLKILFAALILSLTYADAGEWHSWRGDVKGSGTTKETDLPKEWSEEKNVRWRTPLPDRGNSTPIVAGGRVFVTQAVDADQFRGLYCYDRKDGTLLWKSGITYGKPERTHRTNPYCSASPVTDGERIVVSYGSGGLACYDFEGKEIWRRDLGAIDHEWGNSSSPVLFENLCIHYHGPGNGSYLIALDKATGETVWKFDEPEWEFEKRTDGFAGRSGRGVVGSFSTPIIIKSDERAELIVSFPTVLIAFDPATGDQLWKCDGLNPLVYTSPVVGDGIIVTMGGYHGNSLGVKPGGAGDVTDTHRVWHQERHDGGVGSGVVKDGFLYYQDIGGVASCLDIKTGTKRWEERLPGKRKSWGSFLLAGDFVYTLSQPGDSVIFKANPEKFEFVALNDLGETTNSSLVPSDGELIVRTHKALWCIGRKP